MTEREKIIKVIDEWANKAVKANKFDGASVYNPHNAAELADALIAAGIGDVEHERFVFKKAYMDFFIRFNSDKEFRNNFYSVTLGCQIRKFEDMMEEVENELAEEREDD